jgi:branched-chain amino acid transport system ATP-binding protein
VDHVTLDVAPFTLKSIIGPNGAGKTTFFNLLSGQYRPSEGRILFKGRDITGRGPPPGRGSASGGPSSSPTSSPR